MVVSSYKIPTVISRRHVNQNVLILLKKGVWAYFLLLIFEGALRKWLLPGLSTPLLLIRDPLAIWLLFMAWKHGYIQFNIYIALMALIGFVGIYTAFLFGHGSLPVAVYGARIMLFQFPLIFVIGQVFNRDDVVRLGKTIIWIAIPMTILIALQFYSSQSAWVNRGLGGDIEGAGFSGALGFYRPPATFSFTNGTTLFYGLVSSFLIYFWINPKYLSHLIRVLATTSLIAAIPLSISRGLFFSVAVTIIFAVIAISRKPRNLGKIVFGVLSVCVVLAVLSKIDFFDVATTAFSSRFETANEIEGGVEGILLDRYMGGMFGALSGSANQPFFGYGLGMGTNVGSMLLTGNTTYLIAEGEWGRLIGELGPLLGLGVICLRVGLSIDLAFACYQKVLKGDLLPWMLLSFGALTLAQGQWAQPTTLGFSILTAGLILASLNKGRKRI